MLFVVFLFGLVAQGLSQNLPRCPAEDAFLHHPLSCNYFLHCAHGHPFVKRCPLNLVFSTIKLTCLYPNSLYDDCTPRFSWTDRPATARPPFTVFRPSTFVNQKTTHQANQHTWTKGSQNTTPKRNPNPTPNINQNSTPKPIENTTPKGNENPKPTGNTASNPNTTPRANPTSNQNGNPTTAPAPNELQGRIIHLFGEKSSAIDGARSSIFCPSGSIVLNCVCNNERNGCDGSKIVGQRCSAFNGAGGTGQRAIGVCIYDDSTQWRLANGGLRRRPEAFCPSGYQVTACTLWDRWARRDRVLPLLDRNRNSCRAASICRNGLGCSIQAICNRI